MDGKFLAFKSYVNSISLKFKVKVWYLFYMVSVSIA